MFGSVVLDVAIGMCLLFLFMSLIATALRELIGNITKARAKDLERGIATMLSGPGSNYVADFYNHPLISSLFKGNYKAGSRRLPAYIPRGSFSLAVLDLFAKASATGQPLDFAALRTALANGGAPDAVQRAVLTAIDTANGDLDKARTAVEDWFDATMDRVSGWYTARTNGLLLVIGLGAAVFFNVDAITVGRLLMRDKPLRDAVVAQATQIASRPAPGAPAAAPVPPAAPAASATDGADDAGKAIDASLRNVSTLSKQFAEIGFPIGWTLQSSLPYPTPQACQTPATSPPPSESARQLGAPASDNQVALTCSVGQGWDKVGFWVMAALGWLITALAIMLGAPFWFDVLNKFIVVRSTIKPREKSRDEASPDRQPVPVRIEHVVAAPGR